MSSWRTLKIATRLNLRNPKSFLVDMPPRKFMLISQYSEPFLAPYKVCTDIYIHTFAEIHFEKSCVLLSYKSVFIITN